MQEEEVKEPNKTYHIGVNGQGNIFAQVSHYKSDTYSIRIILAGDNFHTKYAVCGYIWNVIKNTSPKDFIFNGLQEAETCLEELATENNWTMYY